MLTCRGACDGKAGMEGGRSADDDSVDVAALEEVLGTLVDGDLYQAGGPRASLRVRIGGSNEGGTTESGKHPEMDPVGNRPAAKQAEAH